MMSELLRTYVRLLLSERPRSKTFNMEEFKMLRDLNQIQDYAFTHLEEIGLGSSRAAYVLNNRYVLKVAQTSRGIAQNNAEIKIAIDPAAKDLVTRILKRGPKSYWILSELVRPLESRQEFRQLTGISLEELGEQIKSGQAQEPFARMVMNVAQKTNLELQDLVRISSWGKSADGRVVLLDSGYTDTVKKLAAA